jgi:hypothetical protein
MSAKKKASKRTPVRRARAARPAGRKTARPGARKAAPKRRVGAAAPKRRAARPALALVPRRRRRAKPAPPPAFPQTSGASGKQLLLFQIVRARASFLAAIHGLPPAAALLPMGGGKWSVRETVLHLIARDRARLREMEHALHGARVSWATATTGDWARINAEEMVPLAALGWDEALRVLQTARQKLMEDVEAVPEQPAEVWAPAHAFGEMLAWLPPHDRHHAEIVKRWRSETRDAET